MSAEADDFFAGPSRDFLLLAGDAERVLAGLPGGVFQTAVTSPPYWSLRDYGVAGQIGMEDSVEEYIERLVRVFDQVGRALGPDGTLWINIGDSYTSGGRKYRARDRKNPDRSMRVRPRTPEGLKPKDLVGVPWRLAFALQRRGWHLRADIVWSKPNCQPESVRDRPTRSHEYVFLLAKSERYLLDARAWPGPNGRRPRSVWEIPTRAASEERRAAYPDALVEPCLAMATRPGDLVLDPFVGSGTTGAVALRAGRRFVGVDLNPGCLEIARARLVRERASLSAG